MAMSIEVQNLDILFHITAPWYIEDCIFNEEKKQLDVYVAIHKGAVFCCSHCGSESQPVYDIADYNRKWRHLNFLEHPCYIHAELPRTKCVQCGKIRRVDVPWSVKPRSNFTLLFDALIITMAKDMPMSAISRLVKEHDTQLWRIIHYYVDHAIEVQDLSHVTMISTDETSAKKGPITEPYLWTLNKGTLFMSRRERTQGHGLNARNTLNLIKAKQRT
jgi:transposase